MLPEEEALVNARQKLNRATINGCLLAAGVLGYVSGSWLVFVASLAAALALNWHAGDIRTRRQH